MIRNEAIDVQEVDAGVELTVMIPAYLEAESLEDTPYGCSKGAADQYMLDYARGFGLKTVVFRHSTIYGGRQFATYDPGVGGLVLQAGA